MSEQGENVVYFNGQLPVFFHRKDDLARFRMFNGRLIVQGSAAQGDVAETFGVPLIEQASAGVKLLANKDRARPDTRVKLKAQRSGDLAARIYRQLAGARGLDEAERWQHALFFAMSPQERCHFSLKTARSALSLKRSAKKK